MGDLLPLHGFQLLLEVESVYPDNAYSKDVFKFGPFRTEQALKKWQIRFVDCFQKELDQEKDKIKCTIPRDHVGRYDFKGPVFLPRNPQANAEEIVNVLLSLSPQAIRESLKGPLLWEAVVRIKMKKRSAQAETLVVVFPFENPADVSNWIQRFLSAITSQCSAQKDLRLQVFNENTISEEAHFFGDDEFEIEEYVINSKLDPEEEGEALFNFLMSDLNESHKQMP